MARRPLLPLIVFTAGLASVGCSTHHIDQIDGPIDYLSAGGLGGNLNNMALHIELDGTAMRPKAGGGMETATLDTTTLDDLHGQILDAEFETLAPTYLCNCADALYYRVSVHLDGGVRSVGVESGAQPLPPASLQKVISTLQSILRRPLDWR